MSTRLAPLLLLLAAAACAPRNEPTGCRTDAQCPAASRCGSGRCIADAPPVAALRPVGAVRSYDLVELDGSASHDPDDRVAEHVWTVRAVEAPCAAPEAAGRDPRALVRFGCPGRYEVSLAVRDGLGLESAPARAEVEVLPATGEPVVAAGPDVATEHVCAGAPLLCRTEDVVRLAAATAPGLALRWSVQPPAERPLDDGRRVRFLPDAAAAAPVAQILTDGTAISGDWIFRVEALDAYGVVGAAHTRVSVRNRPPVVLLEAAPPFPHAFEAARSAFTSAGAVGWAAFDPDGDPLEIAGIWRHVGDGDGATFDGDFAGTTVTFAVEVPYAAPGDALRLRGGEGLSRAIEVEALDSNRALGRAVAEIAIGNRPPVPAGGAFDAAVPHRFDRERSRYVATLRAGSYVDPDGDPLVDAEVPGLCGKITMEGNDATVECAVPFEGVPALDALAGTRTIPVPVRDPWDVATVVPVRTVTILNTPPRLTAATTPARVTAAPVPSLGGFGTPCTDRLYVGPVAFDVAPEVSDPDGDPIVLSAVAASGGTAAPLATVLTGADVVPFHFTEGPYSVPTSSCFLPWKARSSLVASDGAAATQVGVSPLPR